MSSYSVVKNIDGVLAQLTRLVGNGYYFYFQGQLKLDKDPEALDRKLIKAWQLDAPYWKREKRRRGQAPSIWYLRWDRHYLLISTHGKTPNGAAHPFFEEYGKTLKDIRKYALYFCGYSIRYPVSKETGKRRVFVRLDKDTYLNLRARLCRDGIRQQFRERTRMEAEFASLPYQPYRPVREQLTSILREVNRRRRYAGFVPLRFGCIPAKMRVARVYAKPIEEGSQAEAA